MKKELIIVYTIILLSIILSSISRSESLQIIKTIEIPSQKFSKGDSSQSVYLYNAFIKDSNVYLSSNRGLQALLSSEDTLITLIESEPYRDNWWKDFEVARDENALFSPGKIWNGNNKNNLFVFDSHINSFYTVDLRDRKNIKINIWKKRIKGFSLNNPSIYNEMILYSILGSYSKLVGMSGNNLSDFQIIFECPQKLAKMLDSLWADHVCSPVFNPIDSTIWIAFNYYNYVYIIDFQGKLLDSVKIDSPDFKIPQPPLSRIKSNAVFQDWASKTTPVTSFNYTRSGYYILQFYSNENKIENTNIGNNLTLAWDIKSRKPVKLDVDKFWKVVGVQDERVIFKHCTKDGDEYKTVLYVTRIEP